ncbi:MAG: hypothetical protein ACTSYS_07345, partial [Promethearchaeota archaeon]
MKKKRVLNRKKTKLLIPLIAVVFGAITPMLLMNFNIIGYNKVENTDSDVFLPDTGNQDINATDNEPQESIVLDPEYIDGVISSTGQDFHMEDMAYGFSKFDDKYYLALVGYQWQLSTSTSNVTWRVLLYEINYTAPSNQLIYRAMYTPSSSEDSYKYNSTFSNVVLADVNEDNRLDLVCGGNITYNGYSRAYFRVFQFRYGLPTMYKWEYYYNSFWNTTLKSMDVADVNGDGHLDLIVNPEAYLTSRSLGLVLVYHSIYTGDHTNYGYYNLCFEYNDFYYYESSWESMKIAELNGDNIREIVLGGHVRVDSTDPSVPALLVLNYIGGHPESDFNVMSIREFPLANIPLGREDFSDKDMGINPNGTDGWIDKSTGFFTEVKTVRKIDDHFEVLQIKDSDTSGYVNLEKVLSNQDNFIGAFDIYVQDTSRLLYMYFYTPDNDLKFFVRIFNGELQTYDLEGGFIETVWTFPQQKWMNLGYEYNGSYGTNGSYRLLIEGHAITKWFNCYSTTLSSVDSMVFSTSAPGSGQNYVYYLDNLEQFDLDKYNKGYISSIDIKDANDDGSLDVVASINYIDSSGEFSTQVVINSRLKEIFQENFESYNIYENIKGKGFWNSSNKGTATTKVISSSGTKVLELNDPATDSYAQAWWELPGTVPENGSLSFRFKTTNTNLATYLYLSKGVEDDVSTPTMNFESYCSLLVYQGNWYHSDGGSYVSTGLSAISNTWYDVVIYYDLSEGWHARIGTNEAGETYTWNIYNPANFFDHFEIRTYESHSSYISYIDNISVSWDVDSLPKKYNRYWDTIGNVNLESSQDGGKDVLVLKRNVGMPGTDFTNITRAMLFGFNEIAAGKISFWVKSKSEWDGRFHIIDLYQEGGSASYPWAWRFFVDPNDGLRIKMNWTDTGSVSPDHGGYWLDRVWHKISIDFWMNGGSYQTYLNFTYDGDQIWTNRRCEYAWESVNNISFSLSEEYAGELYIDNLKIDMNPKPVSWRFNRQEETQPSQAKGSNGLPLSTTITNLKVGNFDDDPFSEIFVAVNSWNSTFTNPGLHKFVVKNGMLQLEGNFYSVPSLPSKGATKGLVVSDQKEGNDRFAVLGGNYYYQSNGKTYFYLNLLAISQQKQDRTSLVHDDGAFSPLMITSTNDREYMDMKSADVDSDGNIETLLLSNDVVDPERPFYIEVFRKASSGLNKVFEQKFNSPIGGDGFEMHAMLIKDIDHDGILEILVTGSVFSGGTIKWGITWMLEFNQRRHWPSEPYFVGNEMNGILNKEGLFPDPPFQFRDAGGSPKDTTFLAIDAEDVDRDGVDEVITAGYFQDGLTRSPGLCVWDFDGTQYVLNQDYKYYSWHSTIQGQINALKILDLETDGIYDVILGGNSTYFGIGQGPANHADLRAFEITPDLTLTDRRMAIWQYYSTGVYGWNTYTFSQTPLHTATYSSEITDLEISDLDYDGSIEICVAGIFTSFSLSANLYGSTHIIQWNKSVADFALLNHTIYNDNNLRKAAYSSIAVANIDYDHVKELVVGGVSSTQSQSSDAHDNLNVINPNQNGQLYPTTVEANKVEENYSKTATRLVDIADIDGDGVQEILTLINDQNSGWNLYAYNKTKLKDVTAPELVSLNDTLTIVGGNVTLFSDDFESGFAKWEANESLWHITGNGSAWPDSYHSFNQSAWFGIEATGNFETGSRVNGSLVSMPFDLSGVSKAFLEFYHWRRGEGGNFDNSSVFISTNGGISWIMLYSSTSNVDPWEKKIIDLTSYCGNASVKLRFYFDSVDGISNNYRGWLVDDVKVYSNETTYNLSLLIRDQGEITLVHNGSSMLTSVVFSTTPWIQGEIRDEPWTYIMNFTFELKYLHQGYNIIRFNATDKDSHETIIDYEIYYDQKVPGIHINNPVDGQMFSSAPSFNVEIFDDMKIKAHWYEVFAPESGNVSSKIFFNSNDTLDSSIWSAIPENQSICWRFYVLDKAGNVGGSVVYFFKDITPPTVNVTKPLNLEVFSHAPEFEVTISDFASDDFWYDVYVPSLNSTIGSASFTSNGTMDGTIWDAITEEELVNWTFYAEDEAGNIGSCVVQIEKDTSIADIEVNFINAPDTVVQAQEDIQVEVLIDNVGFNNATIVNIYIWMENSYLNTTIDYTADYSIELITPMPAIIPAGQSKSFYFRVNVHQDAKTSVLEVIDAACTAFDDRTGDDVSDSGAQNTGSWTVITPSNLQIVSVNDVPDQDVYVQDMSATIRVALHNYGDARVTVNELYLLFTNNGTPVQGFSHATVPSFSVLGGQTVARDIVVSIAPNSSIGDVIIDAIAKGVEQYTSNDVIAFTNGSQLFLYNTSISAILHDSWRYGPYIFTVGSLDNGINDDALIVKWDSAGNVIGNVTLDFGGSESFRAITGDDDYIYAVGNTDSFGNGSADLILFKWDREGNLIWNRTWGGPGFEDGKDVILDGSYIYTVGNTYSYGAALSDVLLLKWTVDGDLVWNVTYKKTNNDYGYGLFMDNTGNIFSIGYSNSFSSSFDALLLKWNSNGTLLWDMKWDGDDNDYMYAISSDGSYLYTVGTTYSYGAGGSDQIILKWDFNGFVVQYETFGGVNNDKGSDILVDGNVIFAVGSTLSFGYGQYDFLGTRWNSSLSCNGNATFGYSLNDKGNAITLRKSFLYMAGTSERGSYSKPALVVLSKNGEGNRTSIFVQEKANIEIVNVTDITGRGLYIEGETFEIEVTFQNTGGTAVLNADAILDFGGYGYLSASDPASVTVPAGGNATQLFNVTVMAGAFNSLVSINCSGSGNENISGKALSIVNNGPILNISIQSQAQLTITAIVDVTGRGIYIGGETFIVRVDYQNSGGTDALSVDAVLDFHGYWWATHDNPVPVTVPAGGTASQTFTVFLHNNSESVVAFEIDANATGFEEYTNRALIAYSGANDLDVSIQAMAQLEITSIEDITGRGTYVEGETFTVRMVFLNSGGTRVLNTDGLLLFGGYVYLSQSNPAPKIVEANSSAWQDFVITVLSGANDAIVNITGNASGNEEYTNRSLVVLSTNVSLLIKIQSQANLTISGIEDVTNNTNYVEGMSFVIRVHYQNTGGTAIVNLTTTLSYNGYTHLSSNASGIITVNAYSNASQDFLITVDSGATTLGIIIDADGSGNENHSGRAISASSGNNDLHVNIYSGENAQISTVVDTTGNPSYNTGENLTVRVTITNLGSGVKVFNGTCNLTFGAAYGYNASPVSVNENLTIPAGGQITIDFNVFIALNATTGNINIDANFTGVEEYSLDIVTIDHANSYETIFVKQPSKIRISSVIDLTNQPAYVQGQNLEVKVTLDNTQGTSNVENGTLTLEFSDTGYSQNASYSNITVSAGGSAVKYFNVSISPNATTGTITIDARFEGDVVGGEHTNITADNPEDIYVQSVSDLEVTAMQVTPEQDYVQGTSVTVIVSIENYGGTSVNQISLSLQFNGTGYTYATPALFSVGPHASIKKTIVVSIASNATSGNITINSTLNGVEDITGNSISVTSQENSTWVNVITQATLSIISITDLSGNGTYIEGESFTVRVTYQNTGDAAINNLDGILDFNTYSYLSQDDPGPITLSGHSTLYQDFNVTVLTGAPTSIITIDASANGTEQYSGRVLSATSGANDLSLNIQSKANLVIVSIVDITGRGVYVEGETFVIRVNYQNAGDSDALNVNSTIIFSGTSFMQASAPAPVTVPAGGINNQDFNITLLTGISNMDVEIDANATGQEEYSGRHLSAYSGSNDLTVQVQSQADLVITSIEDISGNGTYIEGESFVVRVHYQNSGGTDALSVDSTLDFNGYAFLSSSNPAAVTVPASGTGYQDFTISVSSGATNSPVTIDASGSGNEQYTSRTLSFSSGTNDLEVDIQSQASLAITSIVDISGNGTYIEGETFTVRVNYQNTGGTDALNVDAT